MYVYFRVNILSILHLHPLNLIEGGLLIVGVCPFASGGGAICLFPVAVGATTTNGVGHGLKGDQLGGHPGGGELLVVRIVGIR